MLVICAIRLDFLSTKRTSMVCRCRAHQKSTKATRDLWLNNTYKEKVRLTRQQVIWQDNKLLYDRLSRTGVRRSEYDDEIFAEIYKRRKYARDFSRRVDQNERAKDIDYENQVPSLAQHDDSFRNVFEPFLTFGAQNMLRRLTGTTAVYDHRDW